MFISLKHLDHLFQGSEENYTMSTKILYIICSMIIFIALIIDDIILMLLALSVVVTSITDAWWRQEIDRKNRISGLLFV